MPRERSRDKAIAESFGQRVREVRLERGMTQEQLAEMTGVHPTFISNVERGYRVASVPTLLRLAAGLRVSPSDLIDRLDPAG